MASKTSLLAETEALKFSLEGRISTLSGIVENCDIKNAKAEFGDSAEAIEKELSKVGENIAMFEGIDPPLKDTVMDGRRDSEVMLRAAFERINSNMDEILAGIEFVRSFDEYSDIDVLWNAFYQCVQEKSDNLERNRHLSEECEVYASEILKDEKKAKDIAAQFEACKKEAKVRVKKYMEEEERKRVAKILADEAERVKKAHEHNKLYFASVYGISS